MISEKKDLLEGSSGSSNTAVERGGEGTNGCQGLKQAGRRNNHVGMEKGSSVQGVQDRTQLPKTGKGTNKRKAESNWSG